jgi:hypothetical protein
MPDPTIVRIVVEIAMKDGGEVKTSHRPLTSDDQAQMDEWPSAGLVYLAHALFIEALRREAYTTMIALLSQGTKREELTVEDLDAHMKAHWIKMMNQFGKSAAEIALKSLD